MTPTIRMRPYENPALTYAQCLTTAHQLQSAVKQLEEGVAISTIDNGGKAQRSTATPSVAVKEEPVATENAVPPSRYISRQQATPFSKSGQCSQQATPFSNQGRITCYNSGKVGHIASQCWSTRRQCQQRFNNVPALQREPKEP